MKLAELIHYMSKLNMECRVGSLPTINIYDGEQRLCPPYV